jgi:tetratricopeptide (TPR) repeat protein
MEQARFQLRSEQNAEAEKVLRRVLAAEEKRQPLEAGLLGDIHQLLTSAIGLQRITDPEQLVHLREAARFHEQTDGFSLILASHLGGISLLERNFGAADAVLAAKLKQIEVLEKVRGDHFDTARALDELAQLYVELRQLPSSEKMLRRALQIREHLAGPESRSVGLSLLNLATVLEAQGGHEAEIQQLKSRSAKLLRQGSPS